MRKKLWKIGLDIIYIAGLIAAVYVAVSLGWFQRARADLGVALALWAVIMAAVVLPTLVGLRYRGWSTLLHWTLIGLAIFWQLRGEPRPGMEVLLWFALQGAGLAVRAWDESRKIELAVSPFTSDVVVRRPESLAYFRALFAALPPLEPGVLSGTYRAEFVGPRWLRWLAPRGLALLGLRGWCGKAFDAAGQAINLVQRDGGIARVLPMHVGVAPSLVDDKHGVRLCYPPGSPLPWPWVVDELRPLPSGTLLALTLTTPGWLPRIPLPFILQRD